MLYGRAVEVGESPIFHVQEQTANRQDPKRREAALLRFQARLTLMLANHRAPKRRRQYCCERMAALDVEIAQARGAKEIRGASTL
jgi:hypothetical protein